MNAEPEALTIVGIGASAGGLDAFRRFFQAIPSECGMAFVVILHLPADRRSMLPEILSRWTDMRVVEVSDDQLIEADCVYVPLPHAVTSLRHGHLLVSKPAPNAMREDRPIDGFFDAMAIALHERAVGIVLSGTGTDGSLGLKAIKEAGGLTMAQGGDGARPQYDGMPMGAIATGAVDLIVGAEEMPGHLMRLRRVLGAAPLGGLSSEATKELRLKICSIVRAQLDHDFSGYKDRTFLRRVQRRMQVVNIVDMATYVERLETDRDEVMMLFRDLLIRVTSFFRDAEVFEVLKREAIPRLFDGKQAKGVVRVWVPGCATGEEAYSLAILLREHMDTLPAPPKVQVFATDIDEPAIATARAGRYPRSLLSGLSPARLARFFNDTGNGYVVAKEIRELCTFSPHSLVRDPPFSRMDLISCRNLLIYLDTRLQGIVIPAFHYSLNPDGILLLGTSETAARFEELFVPVDKPARIFQRRDVPSPALQLLTSSNDRRMLLEGRSASLQSGATWTTNGPDHENTNRERLPASSTTGNGSAHRAGMARVVQRLQQGLMGVAGRLYPDLREVDRMRREVRDTREELRSVTEEHATALEELRSANEELHSVNEELQSTNEELETSKEETQSVNEELHTVNGQLSEKIDELDHANSDLRNLFASTDVATVFLDPHLVIRGFTPAVGTIYNLIPSDEGRPLTDIVSHLDYTGLREDVRQVLDTLEPLERRVAHQDNGTHYILRILPYRGPDSRVNGTLVTFVNVTSIVQAEQHQKLLVDELNHRVKNMLTVVISLATQTLRRSGSLEEFSTAFLGRLHALNASYSLLSRDNWSNVSLRDVLLEETQPFQTRGQANVVLDGPTVMLASQGALALSMAIHELATNAVKYGSLSGPQGTVAVSWRYEPDAAGGERMVLDWIERGGPLVREPQRRGFGLTMIERGFAHELSGDASVQFTPDGLRAQLRAPLGKAVFRGVADDTGEPARGTARAVP